MAIPTANGFALLSAEINEPLVGRWVAKITADVPDDLDMGAVGDAITLDFEDGEATFVGTIVRGNSYGGAYSGLVVGGANGLATEVDAKQYVTVAMASVLADLMTATGETLSTFTDADVTTFFVPSWVRMSGQAQNALDAIRETLGADWQIFRDGTLWMGTNTFPESSFEFQEIDRDNSLNAITIAPESGAPLLAAGVTFEGEEVHYVTTSLSETGLTQTYLVAA